MLEYFAKWKQAIFEVVQEELQDRKTIAAQVQTLGPDAIQRIEDFTNGGKMLRGGLVCLAYQLVQNTLNKDALLAAGAMELFQSALLIHDDIMDRDLLRRGDASIFNQYKMLSDEIEVEDSYHLGEALGICSGDLAFFLGFELLTLVASHNSKALELITLCSKELAYVGIAQMADVLRGAVTKKTDTNTDMGKFLEEDDPEKAVLQVYQYKTGRYTFSLPMMAGAILAGANNDLIKELELLGEELGVLFQLKDDEIGIFGDEAVTGKPRGSDLREGKKTLFYVYANEQLQARDKFTFLQHFGDTDAEDSEIETLISLLESSKIKEQVQAKSQELAEASRKRIQSLPQVNEEFQKLLLDFVDYNLTREK
jgi:geranylgeranyl diphosphate synthase type I